jgi:hypothetical protein
MGYYFAIIIFLYMARCLLVGRYQGFGVYEEYFLDCSTLKKEAATNPEIL